MKLFLAICLLMFSLQTLAGDYSKKQCKEIYQGWFFNRVLEEVCEIGGVASFRIGTMAKAACGDVLSEEERNAYSLEVATAFRKDIQKMGRERLCEIEVPRYHKMLETLFE